MKLTVPGALALAITLPVAFAALSVSAEPALKLNDKGYFEAPGLNVTVFADIYPDGHQTGVTVIQHGVRTAANGDLRLEASPGQWSPMPKGDGLKVDVESQTITQTLSYPDPSKNRTGFNPIEYPDLNFSYSVRVTPLEGNSFLVAVDLEQPLPAEWEGRVGFNFELFPTDLFGKSWMMNGQGSGHNTAVGYFPRQANGPVVEDFGEIITAPLATGTTLTVAPEAPLQRMKIESRTGTLHLLDGRGNHNNGWYIVRETTRPGATKDAITWVITPNTVPEWRYEPVIQVSQVGYLPSQTKTVIIETDSRESSGSSDPVILSRLSENGPVEVMRQTPKEWGSFLRYHYRTLDFTPVTQPGLYTVTYRDKTTHAFKIGEDVYDRGVWQPTLEVFLPVQMAHMLVREKYRIWHGLGHMDDARMAPINLNHFDGYVQGPETLTTYKSGEFVPHLDAGGWYDAGDYDLRIESQMGTIWLLTKMVEEFGLDYDATTIDQENNVVEIRQPDGRNDALQQIEHGLLSVLGGYKAMGRTYRGIIEPRLDQYVLLGDGSLQTDNLRHDPALKPGERTATHSSLTDDRWVFTEDNPNRELNTAAGLAAASRVMRGYNNEMADQALTAAVDLYDKAIGRATSVQAKTFAASELAQTTGDAKYTQQLIAMKPEIVAQISNTGPVLAGAMPLIKEAAFVSDVDSAVKAHQTEVARRATLTPYGVPYEPNIWGAGWTIQEFGVEQYFFRKGWPQHTPDTLQLAALDFVLGVHPGENTMSFASGVGANSATTAYGFTRADWSYIPGGVISGTALIRPDLPELKIWPYFWQQTEYVMGGGETNYMFLVLAAKAKK